MTYGEGPLREEQERLRGQLNEWFRKRDKERDARILNALLEYMPRKAIDTIRRTRKPLLFRFHHIRLEHVAVYADEHGRRIPPGQYTRAPWQIIAEEYLIIHYKGERAARVNLL